MTTNKARVLAGEAKQLAAETISDKFRADFLEHWKFINRLLLRLVGDSAEAEDLALETFWQLYCHPPNTYALNLRGWLYCVATNLGFNAIRARKRRTQYEMQASAQTKNEIQVIDALAVEEERQCVRQVLAAMDSRQAQILLLRYSEMSYKEIAATIGVAPNSIGTLLARAEREFEKRFRELGE